MFNRWIERLEDWMDKVEDEARGRSNSGASQAQAPARVRMGMRRVRQLPDGSIEYVDDAVTWGDWSDATQEEASRLKQFFEKSTRDGGE